MTEPENVWHVRRWLIGAVLALNILAVVGVVTTAVFIVQQRNYVECQRAYNDSVQSAIKERGLAGSLDRQAIRLIAESGSAMIDSILRQPPLPREDQISALQRWRDAQNASSKLLSDAEKQREQNPLPSPQQC